jgi:hypothetical protein
MIKRQLGGMLDDYILHKRGVEVPKTKPNSNMIECVKEF